MCFSIFFTQINLIKTFLFCLRNLGWELTWLSQDFPFISFPPLFLSIWDISILQTMWTNIRSIVKRNRSKRENNSVLRWGKITAKQKPSHSFSLELSVEEARYIFNLSRKQIATSLAVKKCFHTVQYMVSTISLHRRAVPVTAVDYYSLQKEWRDTVLTR